MFEKLKQSYHFDFHVVTFKKINRMANKNAFIEHIKNGYSFQGETIKIGAAMLDGEVIPEAEIFLPLKTMNRHGLVAGATGTGKTKSFQMIAEGLSDASVPVLLMDIKGDLSGIGAAGTANDKITERYQALKMDISSRRLTRLIFLR